MVYVRYILIDAFNLIHLKKHKITLDEILAVCQGRHITKPTYNGRLLLIGQVKGRIISVVIAPRMDQGNGVFYTVSARAASNKERKEFNQLVKGGRHD